MERNFVKRDIRVKNLLASGSLSPVVRDFVLNINDFDFADDLPNDTEKEWFRKHNRFLRTLKEDTLLIVDNFNTTATQEEFLSVILEYRCRILFTSRKEDPYLETREREERFVGQIIDAVETATGKLLPDFLMGYMSGFAAPLIAGMPANEPVQLTTDT